MSNNGGNNGGKSNASKRGRGGLEPEGQPRRISTSNINTEAPTQFVLRGRPLERPVYTLRSPTPIRSDSNSIFPGMWDSEETEEAQQETASTPSPGPSRTERSPRTPLPRHQMAPPAANLAAAAPRANASSTVAPSTPVNAPGSSVPAFFAGPNPFSTAPTPPATPANSAALATPSPSTTRSPSRAWTTGEEAALAESVRYVVEHGGHNHPVLEMWEIIGRRVREVHDVQKTGSACRLWYCRKLRAETGFDERKVAKANMVTCSQKPAFGGRRRRRRDDDEDERGEGKAGLVGR